MEMFKRFLPEFEGEPPEDLVPKVAQSKKEKER
jgi:hypothetical protein